MKYVNSSNRHLTGSFLRLLAIQGFTTLLLTYLLNLTNVVRAVAFRTTVRSVAIETTTLDNPHRLHNAGMNLPPVIRMIAHCITIAGTWAVLWLMAFKTIDLLYDSFIWIGFLLIMTYQAGLALGYCLLFVDNRPDFSMAGWFCQMAFRTEGVAAGKFRRRETFPAHLHRLILGVGVAHLTYSHIL